MSRTKARYSTRRRRLRTISAFLLALAIADALIVILVGSGVFPLLDILRPLCIAILALPLMAGRDWARRVMVVVAAISGAWLLLSFSYFFFSTSLLRPEVQAFLYGYPALGGVYLAIAIFLAVSNGVTREILRANG
ncbi:hypothetical protein OpiT1DRAFT_02098 [Opitutaceae bacterium TAV1]|nr:hypothetical protein OpiT1DRAFT_02098 [Opitutaceae bacterium TAV1]